MSNDGLFTDGSNQFAPKVDSIPLSDADTSRRGEASIGQLVSNATEQMSQLVRSTAPSSFSSSWPSFWRSGSTAGLRS